MSNKPTTKELVERYNAAAAALGRKPVKKFADRETAERRVAAIEAEVPPKPKRPAYDPDALGEKRGLRFDLPGRPAKERVEPREGTRRARLLEMLREAGKDGVDFEDLHAECGFKNRKSTRDAIGLLSRRNGYGVQGTDACLWLDADAV